MSNWERDANAALQALGESYQQGGISRMTYRERRRRLLASLRERLDVTERNPLHVGQPPVKDGNLSGGTHIKEAPAVGRRWRVPLLAVTVLAVLVVIAVVGWSWT